MNAIRPNDSCVELLYLSGTLVTMQMWGTFGQAMERSKEGQWFEIDHGYRSADGRTLLIRQDRPHTPHAELVALYCEDRIAPRMGRVG